MFKYTVALKTTLFGEAIATCFQCFPPGMSICTKLGNTTYCATIFKYHVIVWQTVRRYMALGRWHHCWKPILNRRPYSLHISAHLCTFLSWTLLITSTCLSNSTFFGQHLLFTSHCYVGLLILYGFFPRGLPGRKNISRQYVPSGLNLQGNSVAHLRTLNEAITLFLLDCQRGYWHLKDSTWNSRSGYKPKCLVFH